MAEKNGNEGSGGLRAALVELLGGTYQGAPAEDEDLDKLTLDEEILIRKERLTASGLDQETLDAHGEAIVLWNDLARLVESEAAALRRQVVRTAMILYFTIAVTVLGAAAVLYLLLTAGVPGVGGV